MFFVNIFMYACFFYGHHKYVVIFVFYSKIQKKIKYCEYEGYIFEGWIMLIDYAKKFARQPWYIPQFLFIFNAVVIFLT
jgi:hypothetical protein